MINRRDFLGKAALLCLASTGLPSLAFSSGCSTLPNLAPSNQPTGNKKTEEAFIPLYKSDFVNNRQLDSNWTAYNGPHTETDEQQCYTPANVTISGGSLFLTAKKETTVNVNYNPNVPVNGAKTYGYSSGQVRFNQLLKYGRIKVTAKVPVGQGTWPAIWLFGTKSGCGEIDVMEAFGAALPGEAFVTVHYGPDWSHLKKQQNPINMPNLENQFHDYQVDWLPDNITCYIDGKVTLVFDPRNAMVAGQDPMRQPMLFLMDLALGGYTAGAVSDAILPCSMEISSVQIWTYKEN